MDNFYYGLLFGPWREITRDDLGHLGKPTTWDALPDNAPGPDRAQQIAQGIVPTTEHSAIETWWEKL